MVTTVISGGKEFSLGTSSSADYQTSTTVAALPGGGFVAVWVDYAPEPGAIDGGLSIKAQFFGANGAPIGDEILVNTAIENHQVSPSVSVDAQGVLITWDDYSKGVGGATGDSSDTAVKGQFFGLDGVRIGDEVLINTATTGNQFEHSSATLSGGGHVVVWRDTGGGVLAKAQLFDGEGNEVGSEFSIDTATSFQAAAHVTGLDNGNFVVTWLSPDIGNLSYYDVYAQLFSPTGEPIGVGGIVNEATNGGQQVSSIIALEGGGYSIVWTDYQGAHGDASSTAVIVQTFDSAGERVGDETLANSATLGDQGPAVGTALVGGGFVLVWADWGGGPGGAPGDDSLGALKAQLFDASGAKVGDEFLVNTQTWGSQYDPDVTALAGGGFVVVWNDSGQSASGQGDDQSGSVVKAQVYDADGQPVGDEISVNVITDGNQDEPTVTALDDGGFVITWETDPDQDDSVDLAARVFHFETSDNGGPDDPDDVVVSVGGSSANDILAGTSASDMVFAKDGDDQVYAKAGDDTVYGGAGHDRLFGGEGNDAVYGGVGDDVVGGGAGDDILGGGLGNDTIFAGPGNDTVFAGQGDDVVYAGEGDDRVFAGAGDDLIFGGPGNDTLWGGAGNDTIYGGGNADVFGFAAGSGDDDLWGFSPDQGGDRIDLQGQTYEVESDGDGNLVLVLSGGGTVTLHGVDPADIEDGWFI